MVLICFPNRADDGTISGGSWEATLPASNVQDRKTRTVARSTDATKANTQFEVDLSSEYPIKVAALTHHNLSLAAQVRVRGKPDTTHTRASDGTYRDEDGVMQTASSNVARHWHYA